MVKPWLKRGNLTVASVDLSQTGEASWMFDRYDPREHTLVWDMKDGGKTPRAEMLSEGREVTYFWSIRQHRWIAAWDNNTHNFPTDVQREYAARLRRIERRGGLNWTWNNADEI